MQMLVKHEKEAREDSSYSGRLTLAHSLLLYSGAKFALKMFILLSDISFISMLYLYEKHV
jgi:hypothetical protein